MCSRLFIITNNNSFLKKKVTLRRKQGLWLLDYILLIVEYIILVGRLYHCKLYIISLYDNYFFVKYLSCFCVKIWGNFYIL